VLRRVVAAVDQQVGAGHEARRVAGKKDGRLADLVRLAQALQQMLRSAVRLAVSISPKRFTKRSVSTAPGDKVLTRTFCAA
jgi:hypothetical protein